MAVGNGKSWKGEGWHGRAEYFDIKTENWTQIADYGNFESRIFGYASVYSAGSFYIIGGWTGEINVTNKIYKLDSQTWKWSEAGKINKARADHSAVFVKKGFKKFLMVI